MIKKLNLSDFLSNQTSENFPLTYQPKENLMSYELSMFYNNIVEHRGNFVINNSLYTSIIPSTNNIYFFNEEIETIIIFESIIDIKKKDNNMFTIFTYPNTVISILLKD